MDQQLSLKVNVTSEILQELLNQPRNENLKITIETILENTNGSCVRFMLGKNAELNWLIYKASDQSDTIFHLNKFTSPYVIINVRIDMLTNDQIFIAALLCKSKSKHKNIPNIGIMYTSISNTFLGNKIGEFIIKNNKKKNIIKI